MTSKGLFQAKLFCDSMIDSMNLLEQVLSSLVVNSWYVMQPLSDCPFLKFSEVTNILSILNVAGQGKNPLVFIFQGELFLLHFYGSLCGF